jgi:hypothetical protein
VGYSDEPQKTLDPPTPERAKSCVCFRRVGLDMNARSV